MVCGWTSSWSTPGGCGRSGGDSSTGTVHVHTYQAWVQHSATIADPWSDQVKGYMEFHVFRRRPAWIRLVASGFAASRGKLPYVSHLLREMDRLLGYQLETACRR